MPVHLKPLEADEMREAARVHRAAFDDRIPWLAGLHTPEEDERFFETSVFVQCAVWGAFVGDRLVGFIGFRIGWIDQLYVLPDFQGQGVGSALLGIARSREPELSLWTFQRNDQARRFYERRGFVAVEQTDGSANDEREPDVRYRWRRKATPA